MINMKRNIILLITSLFICSFFSELKSQEMTPTDSAIIWHTSKFRTMLETAVKHHKDSVDVKKISEAGYSAMLKTLDPYSDYLNAEVYQNFKDNYSKTVRTVGISPVSINDTIFVLYVTPESPADSAGIVAGDKIIYLNGESAIGMDSKTAGNELSVDDTTVQSINLVIKRDNITGLLELFLPPKELPIESVTTYFLLPGTEIGYIKSKRFSKTADSLIRIALIELKEMGAKSIMFDIRGHQGGQVDQTAEIVDEFVTEGKTITYIEGKNNDYYQRYISEPNHVAEDMPLIVLVDKNSMSAAEIFAGAIQDLDRGVLIGEVTYGKGMAQKSWSFRDGSAFRLTIGDYYTPSGRNIQKPQNDEKAEIDPALKLQLEQSKVEDIEKIIRKFGGKTKMPVFETENGRVVLGGGGIFPDYFEEQDTTTLLTTVLKQKNIIIEASFQFLTANKEEIIDEYGTNFARFNEEFIISEQTLRHMEIVSRQKKIWNEEMFQTDMDYLKNYYKALIAYYIWGNDGFYLAESNIDRVIRKGIEYMPKTVSITK